MSGAILVDITGVNLLNVLQSKLQELPDRLSNLANESAFITQRNVVEEAPRITGNLKASIRIEPIGLFQFLIYPDEGVAPYALYVILVGEKRRYAGNPFMDRGQEISEKEIEEEVDRFKEWIGELS
jgi:hypothetical protein